MVRYEGVFVSIRVHADNLRRQDIGLPEFYEDCLNPRPCGQSPETRGVPHRRWHKGLNPRPCGQSPETTRHGRALGALSLNPRPCGQSPETRLFAQPVVAGRGLNPRPCGQSPETHSLQIPEIAEINMPVSNGGCQAMSQRWSFSPFSCFSLRYFPYYHHVTIFPRAKSGFPAHGGLG